MTEINLARELELVAAQLKTTLDSLDALEAIIRRVGGYMNHEDQDALRKAITVLVVHGRRKDPLPEPWVNREKNERGQYVKPNGKPK